MRIKLAGPHPRDKHGDGINQDLELESDLLWERQHIQKLVNDHERLMKYPMVRSYKFTDSGLPGQKKA